MPIFRSVRRLASWAGLERTYGEPLAHRTLSETQVNDMSFKCKDSVVVTELGENFALLDMTTGTYYNLNGCGGLIWTKIADGASPQTIVDLMCDEYAIDEQTAGRDYELLVQSLLVEGLLLKHDEINAN